MIKFIINNTESVMPNSNPNLLISYINLRKAVGILGIALPVIVVVGSTFGCCGLDELLTAISAYYHTNMRDVFVGILCILAIFMFSYKGYEKRDDMAGDLACIFALGTALLPTSSDGATSCADPAQNDLIRTIHLISAGALLLTFAYFSYFLFTKTKPGGEAAMSIMKQKRNKLYKVCAWVMVGCIGLIIVYFLGFEERYPPTGLFKPVFWLEAISLWAFGLSWLVKGEVLLADNDEPDDEQESEG
ncbi:MAG: hypothetical protein RJQ09_15125 [Cyclobacteriaceae bacterium]